MIIHTCFNKDCLVCLQVSALDPECGETTPVVYGMDGVGPVELTVHPSTGQLCVATPLDYELDPTYNFMIKASDKGQLQSLLTLGVLEPDISGIPREHVWLSPRWSGFESL